ncbi:MAG: hypothetical protein KKH12_10300 [Gammaproteobacteria bacterium]|nr:hypothetical protein [Gammaproteobacteria bacterium]MBU1482051.1 hypothetical protein [Gammaproteobacteria bacterium]
MSNLVKHLMSARMIFPILVSIVLIGCGGGSGGNTPPSNPVYISGTAAAGAPVVGYVSVRDSSANPQPVLTNIPIAADGHYSVDVSGLTAPYAFLAVGSVGGRSVTLYSAATSADEGSTINITPFTDLIVRNIAASAVDTYINNGGISGLTAAELDAQRVALTDQLALALQAMGLSDSIDLLRATFNADNTGLDRFMDVVKVSTTATTATITNILDAANTLIVDTAAGTFTGTLGTGGLAPSGTPLDGIVQTFETFSALFATSLPSDSDPALLALFTDTFTDDGEGLSAWLTGVTTEPMMIGMDFANVVVDSVDTGTGIAQVHFTPILAGGVTFPDTPGGTKSCQMKRVGDVWLMDGNQRIAWVRVKTVAGKIVCNPENPACSHATINRTGLLMLIPAGVGIEAAEVTGPGLPAGGVRLEAQAGKSDLRITTINPACGDCLGKGIWAMADADIPDVLPNSTYTVQLYNNSSALLATYTEVVPVAPVLNSALPSMVFPALSGMVNLAGRGTITLTPSWSIPTGMRASHVNVWLETATESTGATNMLTTNTALSGTSTLAVNAPGTGSWTSGMYEIFAFDQYAGYVTVNYD